MNNSQILMAILKQGLQSIRYFFKQNFTVFTRNPAYIFWFIINFAIFWGIIFRFSFIGFIVLIFLYTLSMMIALSPIGESILAVNEGVRIIATKKEKQRLMPLFNHVYNKAKKSSPYLSDYIELYIIDSITPNAMAIGSNIIAISKGAIDIMDDYQIKALFAHEFGHIANGDTKATILVALGNTIIVTVAMLIRNVLSIISFELNKQGTFKFLSTVLTIIIIPFDIVIFLFNFIGIAILMSNSRKSEYMADKYASYLGYNPHLIQLLYKLYDISLANHKGIMYKIISSHPIIPFRIMELESWADRHLNKQLRTISPSKP